ncbi:unnamed protein product, partial [Anisakis simplex]|uniref:Remodeling and spacing factor 1 (inferred by orthology to a human protein) n=1 Tax=Anisakis simplex TaxID=6269 RepID=A0A0M3KH88_ANISI
MDIKNEENADVKPDAIVVVKQEEQHPVDITVKEEKECIEKCNGETSDDVKPDENGRMECEIDMKESDDYDELNELISDEVKNGQDSANADKKLETLQIAIKQLYNDPSFAVVCSFFNKFACFLGIKPQNFNKLERLLTSFHETGRVDRELIDLHLTLLRKLNYKSARVNGWERYLLKYCSLNQSLESEYLNIERYGYLHSSINTKLAVLKTLCENQFDYNIKFKDSVS